MTLTAVTVGGRWTTAAGLPSQGNVALTLSATIRNGTQEISAGSTTGTFDGSGRVCALDLAPLIVYANDDAASTPGTSYEIDLTIDGTQLETFQTVISHTSTAVDSAGSTVLNSPTVTLGNLLASSTMVGQSITGANIPSLTTVTGYSFVAAGATAVNTLTLSANATATGACALTIGGVVDLGALVPID